MKLIIAVAAALGLLAGCASSPVPTAATDADYGVLVMAHGGCAEWNRDVSAALAPLQRAYPLEIAFGMADAASLQDGVDRLEARGVERIGVVRLFVSGESWYQRTQQILGLIAGAPARPQPSADPHAGHGAHAGPSMAFWQVSSDAQFAMSRDGLAQAPEMGAVLVERARALSEQPSAEDVLILAHGPADDAENRRWLRDLDARAETVRQALSFRRVQVMALREDWPDKREAATRDIRAFVVRAGADGGRALVIPYRVQGFGPYAEVLEGLDYVADGRGLVPHAQVTRWVRHQADLLRAELLQAGPLHSGSVGAPGDGRDERSPMTR